MIVENHQVAYRHVASKYYNFLPEEIDLAITDFDTILGTHGFHTDGTIFFSIISDPTEEVMTAEIFLPIEESNFDIQTEDEIFFKSYFCIKPMIMTRIMGDFDEQSQVKYWELIDYLKTRDRNQSTPVFVEFKRSHAGETYVEMSVGYK